MSKARKTGVKTRREASAGKDTGPAPTLAAKVQDAATSLAQEVDEMLKKPKKATAPPPCGPADARARAIRRERMQDRLAVRDTCAKCGGKDMDPKQVLRDRELKTVDGGGIKRNRRRWTRAQCRGCKQWGVLIEDYLLK